MADSWELFDKFFYPDAKRVEQSDIPKQKRKGARIAHAVIDEHIEMEKNHEAQDRSKARRQDPPRR